MVPPAVAAGSLTEASLHHTDMVCCAALVGRQGFKHPHAHAHLLQPQHDNLLSSLQWYVRSWSCESTALGLCAAAVLDRWQSVRLALAQVLLEDQQALAAAWSTYAPEAAGAAAQHLTAIKHLLQPLINSALNPTGRAGRTASAGRTGGQYSVGLGGPTRSGALGRELSGRQLACLAESALVGIMTLAEVRWLSWLLGEMLQAAGQLMMQLGLPGQQQVLLQLLDYIHWAQQLLQRQQQQQHQELSAAGQVKPEYSFGAASHKVKALQCQGSQQLQVQQPLPEPLVVLRQLVAHAAAQQLQQVLKPWLNPATTDTTSTAQAAAGSSSTSGANGVVTPAPYGSPNGGMSREQIAGVVAACQKLAEAMHTAHQQTAADITKFVGGSAAEMPGCCGNAAAATIAAAGGVAAAAAATVHGGFQRRSATHAAVAAGKAASAGGSGFQTAAGGSKAIQMAPSVAAAGGRVIVPWDPVYSGLALAAAAARYSVVRAALGDVFTTCPGRSTATLTTVARLSQPLLLLEQQLQAMGLSAGGLSGDAWQLGGYQQQQQLQLQAESAHPQQQQQDQQLPAERQLEPSSSIGKLWSSALAMHSNGKSTSSSSGAGCSCGDGETGSSGRGLQGGVSVASVLGRNFPISSYCSQQQQRLQLQQGCPLPALVPSHHPPLLQQRYLSQQLSSSPLQPAQSLPSSQSSQQLLLQPRLRAAAAELQVDLFPWADMLLLQQQLWVGCCAAEMSVVLQQLLRAERWVQVSTVLPVLPVAGSVVELYRMLQSALLVWCEVLLPAASIAHRTSHAAPLTGSQHQQQRLLQERHRFQRRRQHGEPLQQQEYEQQQQQQHVSAHSAAMCRMMLGAASRLQQQYLSHLLSSWSACCEDIQHTAAAAGGGVRSRHGGGVLLCPQLSVMLNSLLMMRQEAENLEATFCKVGEQHRPCSHSSSGA